MIVGLVCILNNLICVMESPKRSEERAMLKSDSKSKSKGKAVIYAAQEPVVTAKTSGGGKKALAIFDFVLRLAAIGAAITAAVTMATTQERLPFFTQFLQFHVKYMDLPTFPYFVITNAGVTAYLLLSLPFSIVCIVRPLVVRPRILLLSFDIAMVAFVVSAAAAATAIVDLSQNGNDDANWPPMCQQYADFCDQSYSAVVSSYVAGLALVIIVVLLAFALRN